MGCYTHPPGSLRRRGRRLPAGRPELVYSAPTFTRARRSTASERNREEPGVLTRLHAQQDRPLAARACVRESLADFLGTCDALAGDIADHVPGTEALRGCRAIWIDLRDQGAFRLLQAEAVRDVGVDRLDLHTNPSARDRALVLELGHHRFHSVGRNGECDTD